MVLNFTNWRKYRKDIPKSKIINQIVAIALGKRK